ncbi:hypothetical protein [Bacillus sp. FJAT-28004]
MDKVVAEKQKQLDP